MVKLRGMTWDHDRGYNPLVAASNSFKLKHPDVDITWDKRSLQAFADRPLDVIAQEYDFLIIDHPHIGEAAEQGCIISLNDLGYDEQLQSLSQNCIGPSHQSYHLHNKQWALAVDAAAQVACYRPDLLDTPPNNWKDVLELAKQGKVLFPLKPVDAIDSFFTLCANMGDPIAQGTEHLVSRPTARFALQLMHAVASHVPKECLTHNPIETLELMSQSDQYAYCPLLFGYTNYSRNNYRDNLIKFSNIPVVNDGDDCGGSIIGGTGLAISSQCQHQELALEFAFYLAGEAFQQGEYFANDGQPAHKSAWLSKNNNQHCSDFFNNTFETLDKSWLRPRYNGFLYFADQGGDLVNEFLADKKTLDETICGLEEFYQQSLDGSQSYNYE